MIDVVKRNALQRLLLENVVSTEPGEKLDEKLATMSLADDPEDRESILTAFDFQALRY